MVEQLALTGAAPNRVHGHAEFSACGEYRYTLERAWGDRDYRKHVVWIGLNPSTAGATGEDATSRRFLSFTKAFGGASYTTVNLFARVSTDPFGLLDDPLGSVGNGNNDWIASMAARAILVIACWGAPSDTRLRKLVAERAEDVLGVLKNRTLYCLGTTKEGAPRHPLYLPGTERPRIWRRSHGNG